MKKQYKINLVDSLSTSPAQNLLLLLLLVN